MTEQHRDHFSTAPANPGDMPSDTHHEPHPSVVQRFLFANLDIQGAVVSLNDAWQALQRGRHYSSQVSQLSGEFAAVTALIAARMKQGGRLSFQLQAHPPVDWLMMDVQRLSAAAAENKTSASACPGSRATASAPGYDKANATHNNNAADEESLLIRGMARPSQHEQSPHAAGGQLVMTLELPHARLPYQSFVPLSNAEGETLTGIAEIFSHYMTQSEQNPSWLKLAVNEHCAAALFLQKLPQADERDADGFQRLVQLAATVRDEELTQLDASVLLARLFAEDSTALHIFPPQPVRYHCPYDKEKVSAIVRGLGQAEAQAILAEHGTIHIHDEICNHHYNFLAAEVEQIFAQTSH